MSKEGSLARIEKYKEEGNSVLLEQEEQFFKDNYSVKEKVEEVKEEKPKKAKK